jgi:hypothetical protein
LPSTVLTVIVTEPALTPVTTPLLLTVALAVLLLVQVTALFVAFDGATVCVKARVCPTGRVTPLQPDIETPVTGIATTVTV